MNAAIVGAIVWFVIGAGFICAGVLVLAGAGWALIAAGVACLFVCAVILRGLHSGGA